MINILAIDDDTDMTEILKDIFQLNFTCDVDICNGIEGVDGYTKSKRYDLICCDYLMPGVKGDEVVKLIRTSHELNATTPIIMISGHLDFNKDDSNPIWNSVYFIEKPIDPDKLLKTVDPLFEKSS